ncbi:hypothetical protein BMETH_397_1 [methanotrophic bacterial endosymbiont of Bathymodiolus sp.]|nr:hypothetical protein BMETH_397_1 [methanotrophic bacterial endosymbiont of Bathymodiolus sp.]
MLIAILLKRFHTLRHKKSATNKFPVYSDAKYAINQNIFITKVKLSLNR